MHEDHKSDKTSRKLPKLDREINKTLPLLQHSYTKKGSQEQIMAENNEIANKDYSITNGYEYLSTVTTPIVQSNNFELNLL